MQRSVTEKRYNQSVSWEKVRTLQDDRVKAILDPNSEGYDKYKDRALRVGIQNGDIVLENHETVINHPDVGILPKLARVEQGKDYLDIYLSLIHI